jgi:hypothetical protein
MEKKTAALSYFLALTVALSSAGGAFLPETYAKETPSWATQGIGQDVVNLILVVPLLLASTFLAHRGKKAFLFVLGGLYFYCLYSYVLYAFCVHFNRLCFFYCAALGSSVYGLVFLGKELESKKTRKWFNMKRNMTLPALYLLFTALVFYFLWLSEDIPAVLSGIPSQSLAEVGLFTNPIHILDLSIALPAMAIASVQLLRKKPFGYVFFPIMMAFCIVMGAAIGGMTVAMDLKGIHSGLTVAYVFGVVVVLDTAFLVYFFKSLKKP